MDTELDTLKRLNLVELASGYGYQVDKRRSTQAAVAMRHSNGHKIVIGQNAATGHNTYYSTQGREESGSVLDFVQCRLQEMGRPSSIGHVRKELRGGRPQAAEAPRPKAASRQDQAQAQAQVQTWRPIESHPYLQHRGLHQVDPRFQGCVFTDARQNVCFPHQNRQGYCGGEIKNHRFNGQVKGGIKGLWLSILDSRDQRLVIAESALDAMSFHQLHGCSRTRYASFGGGLSPKQKDLVAGLISKAHARGIKIVLAVDNDQAGDEYEKEIRALAPPETEIQRIKPSLKDFNEDLTCTPGKALAS